MKCVQCGAPTKTKRENVKYEASGLPGVTLVNVEVRRCHACGEYEVVIPRIEQLHRVIAHALIRKSAQVAPPEIVFLRKYLGWSGVDFAQHMGTTPETVSRWERGAKPMSSTADRLLRLMVVTKAPVDDYSLDALRAIEKKAKPLALRLSVSGKEWRAVAA